MTHQVSHHQSTCHVHLKEFPAPPVDEAFLAKLVTELDGDPVTALILRGSYARGDASPYSDVDLTRFVKESPEPSQ